MRCILTVFLLVALRIYCAPTTEQIFEAGILENCHLISCSEDQVLSSNPVIKNWFNKQEAAVKAGKSGNDPLSQAMSTAFGMKEQLPIQDLSALKRSQCCVDFSEVMTATSAEDIDKLKYLLVYELNEPCSPETIQAFANGKGADPSLKVQTKFDADRKILTLISPNLPRCSIAFFQNNKVLMMGEDSVLQKAVDRLKQGLPAPSLNGDLQAARARIPSGSHFYLLFAPDKAMQQAIRKHTEDSMAGPTLQELKGVAASLKAEQAVTLNLGLDFSTPQAANMGKAMIFDGMFMGMGAMYLSQSGGPDLPVLSTMKTSLKGNHAAFSCKLTDRDLQALTPLCKQFVNAFAESRKRAN